jgi:anti-sigma B factor antagonist
VTASSIDPGTTDLVTIEVARDDTSARLTVTGEVDSSSAPQVRTRLDGVLDAGARDVTIDLSGVSFLDSAGLCVLAAAHRRAVRSDVRLTVIATSRAVIRPMQITGLYNLLEVVEDEPDSGALA